MSLSNMLVSRYINKIIAEDKNILEEEKSEEKEEEAVDNPKDKISKLEYLERTLLDKLNIRLSFESKTEFQKSKNQIIRNCNFPITVQKFIQRKLNMESAHLRSLVKIVSEGKSIEQLKKEFA
jgi:hypothetical protein